MRRRTLPLGRESPGSDSSLGARVPRGGAVAVAMQSDEVEDDPTTSVGGRRSESESESESGSESESSSSGSSSSSSCFSGSAKSGGLGTSGADADADADADEDADEDAQDRKCADPPATTAATRQRARAGGSDPPRGKRRRPSALEQPQEQPPQRGLDPSAWWSARAAGPSGQGTVYEAMDPEVVDSLVGWAHALGGGGPTPLAGGMDRTGGWGGAAAAAAASGPAGPGYLASVSVAAPSRQERPPRPTLMAYLARAAGAKLAPAHERLAGAVERASRAAAVEVPGSTEWLRRQRREREAQQKRGGGGPTDAGRQGGSLPGGATAGASLRDRSGAATEVPRRPRSKLDVLRGMDRMFDASALVALGVAVEEVLTSALMPLAVAHVQRCRELEHRAARAIGRQGGVRDGVGDFSAANYEAGKGQARASSAAACFEAWTLPVADAVFELAKDKDARTRSGLQGPSMDSFLPSAAPEGFLQGLGSSAMAKASLEEAIARWCAAHGLHEGEVRSSVLGPLIPKCPP